MSEQHPKRILVIGLTDRMGGVETFIYNSTIFSDKTKYEYDYLVHGTDHCVFQNEISEFYGGRNHFYFVRGIKNDFAGWFKDITEFYKTHGKDYDFIHLQTGAASEIIYVFPFCIFYKIKVISHSHNGNGYSPVINAFFRIILNFVSWKRIACSEVAAEWLFGRKAAGIRIVNNGIDTERFQYDKNKGMEIRKKYKLEHTFILGHVGRFSEQKNHEKVIEIFSEIRKSIPGSRLLLVGSGEREGKIRDLVNGLQLDNDVVFVGNQSNMEDYYSAFDVLIMPSLYEGLPIVGIEAQSEGLMCYFSDQIDHQIMITDRAKMMRLTANARVWAKAIIADMNLEVKRDTYAKEMEDRGYSIKSAVKTLESLYEV